MSSYLFLLWLDIIKFCDEKVISSHLVFIILHIYSPLSPLILLLVPYGLPRENLVTSTI